MDPHQLARIITAIRTSGRLRHEDSLPLARAVLVLLDRRDAYPADPEEALVQALASLAAYGDPQ